MKLNLIFGTFLLAVVGLMGVNSTFADASFTENFNTSSEGWVAGTFAPLVHNASGGPDGSGYVTFNSNFDRFDGPTGAAAFRGHDDFDASNDAFVGDWVANHWVTLSAFVRHNAPVPIQIFTRIAETANFPAAAITNGVNIQPNTWTLISFDVNRNNPNLTLEGPFSFETVFEDVGNVQFGLKTPPGYEGDVTPIAFDLDQVTVAVPEPATCGLILLGLGGTLLRRRK